jgi:putative membrane protein
MKNTFYIFSLVVLTLIGCGQKNTTEQDSKKEADKANEQALDSADVDTDVEKDLDFATTAAAGGMFEVNLGKLANQKGSNQQVKAFAQSMVADHGAAGQELKKLASTKSIVLPDTLTDDQQKKYSDLAEKSGADFDKAYIDLMVDDHEKDIKEFEKEAEKGHDPELKAWANGKLPTLNHHLEMAKQAKEALDKKH